MLDQFYFFQILLRMHITFKLLLTKPFIWACNVSLEFIPQKKN